MSYIMSTLVMARAVAGAVARGQPPCGSSRVMGFAENLVKAANEPITAPTSIERGLLEDALGKRDTDSAAFYGDAVTAVNRILEHHGWPLSSDMRIRIQRNVADVDSGALSQCTASLCESIGFARECLSHAARGRFVEAFQCMVGVVVNWHGATLVLSNDDAGSLPPLFAAFYRSNGLEA